MIFERIRRLRFRSFRLSTKLMITYLLLTVVPISILGAISYYQYRKSIEQQFGEHMPRTLQLANMAIEKRMDEFASLPDLIYSSSEIISILRKETYGNQSEKLQDEFIVNNYLTRTYINGNNPDIIGVFMATPDRLFASTRMNYAGTEPGQRHFDLGHPLDENGNAKLLFPNELDLRFENGRPYLLLMKQMTDFDNRRSLGTMFLAIRLDFIESVLGELENPEAAEMWVMDREGAIIYHTDQTKIGGTDPRLGEYPVLNGSFKSFTGNEPRVVSVNQSDRYQWVIAHSISSAALTERTDFYRNVTIVVFIVFAIITSVLSVILALNVSRPIKRLSSLMKHVELGNFSVDLKANSRDEIGLLARSFNSMIAKIRELIQQNYYIEIRQKEAELYALQTQINPHFIYNTLETIGMAVEEEETEQVVHMVTVMGRMLRYSLGNDSRLVRIEDEVQHVRDYLVMQKYRFGSRVDFDIALNVDGSRLYTPKFILQPVVENSIKYGLESVQGVRIAVAVNREFGAASGKQDIVFRIRDNGPGIAPDRLAGLLATIRSNSLVHGKSGVGLKNVHARIVMMFGGEYGLQVDSIHGGGTEVIIRIPVIESTESAQEFNQGSERYHAINPNDRGG
jgi:two-component system sensor histidine kinase YesM